MSVDPADYDGGAEEDGPQDTYGVASALQSHCRDDDWYVDEDIERTGMDGLTFGVTVGGRSYEILVKEER